MGLAVVVVPVIVVASDALAVVVVASVVQASMVLCCKGPCRCRACCFCVGFESRCRYRACCFCAGFDGTPLRKSLSLSHWLRWYSVAKVLVVIALAVVVVATIVPPARNFMVGSGTRASCRFLMPSCDPA